MTNSELGAIDSDNLPKKSNFKKHSGFDAITGKGNFDIGEYISLNILDCFQNHEGVFAFLIKNSVIKNLIHEQRRNRYKIAEIEKLNIDSKKEFNVSVNASLFFSKLNCTPEFVSLPKNTIIKATINKPLISVSNITCLCLIGKRLHDTVL